MLSFGRAFLILTAISTCGCMGFERDWRAAQQTCSNPNDIAGLWEGTWCSHKNGHNGTLRAIITCNCNGTYYAKFHATYLEVVPFGFEMPLSVSANGDVHQLGGSADLGLLAGGVFRYAGEANECHLVANFCAKNDHGVFKMTRVATCGCGGCAGCDTNGCDAAGCDACVPAGAVEPATPPKPAKPYDAESTSTDQDASSEDGGLTGAGANQPAKLPTNDVALLSIR